MAKIESESFDVPARKTAVKKPQAKKRKRQCDSSSDSNEDVDILPGTSRTPTSRQRVVKFVGRRIYHQWIVDGTGTLEWYSGTVLAVVSGLDGSDDAVYEVQYDGEDDSFEVDHLIEDFRASQVKFIDV
ncbi:uncharacterized protein [Argopecten irradians]|uniref:uncharacterized protein n=1 Tax=Argopecten irradians TaxID=31199 RepID=UPI00371478D3